MVGQRPQGTRRKTDSRMSKNLPSIHNTELAVREAFAAGSPMQQMFGAVLDELGGLDFVTNWAEDNPDSFMRLLMAANPAPIQNPHGGGGSTINIQLPDALRPGPLDITPTTIDGD